jgi:Tol biopolymer transport system component
MLPGTAGATQPFWSPDGQSVAFFGGGKLKRVDIGGGPPQTLAEAPNSRGGAWGAAGVIVFAPTSTGPLVRVSATGGDTVAVTRIESPRHTSHRFPQFISDTQFLFYAQGMPDAAGVYLASLDTEETVRLTAADTAAASLPPNWLLFVRQGTLVARRFDRSRREFIGAPLTVADPVGYDPNTHAAAVSVSKSGVIAYRVGLANRRQLAWFDRSGKELGPLAPADENTLLNPELSWDGRRVSVDRIVQNNADVWLLDGTRMTRFTFHERIDHNAVWSPDGTRIAFDSARNGDVHDLFVKPSSMAATEEVLFASPDGKGVSDWSPDGRHILFSLQDQNGTFDLLALPVDGDRKPVPVVRTPFDERQGQFSPDGKWVAYESNESGRFEIYVRPFPSFSSQWQVSVGGGASPRWRRDGKELYYIAPDRRMMATPVTARGEIFEPGTPTALFQTRIVGISANIFAPQYDVSPDGRFLINVGEEADALSPITLLLNWVPREP